MILELNGYASALWVASCVSLATAAVAWTRHTRFPGGRQFALMMTCVVIWSATAALEAGAQEVSAKLVLSKIGYIGIAGEAPLFLQYALAYARKEIRWRLSRALLWMMPVITVGLVLTNELHHLVWTTLVPVSTAHGQILLYGHGTWYWAWVAYYGGVTLTAVAVLVPSAFQYRRIYVW
ncbi:MAG TPA: histidine kinase N-terminal 7TM domain-containing protein, partial [Spirochaetia bacterium]|nr:histidine kinase N-terminal 7TM domain-containing protein [Spirochaetia bacterium]